MPLCITCSHPLPHLYTTYSKADDRTLGKGVRLTQCPNCKRFADKYVEHDYVVLFIDLVLIKPQVSTLPGGHQVLQEWHLGDFDERVQFRDLVTLRPFEAFRFFPGMLYAVTLIQHSLPPHFRCPDLTWMLPSRSIATSSSTASIPLPHSHRVAKTDSTHRSSDSVYFSSFSTSTSPGHGSRKAALQPKRASCASPTASLPPGQ